jgi:hypothetical protein
LQPLSDGTGEKASESENFYKQQVVRIEIQTATFIEIM